MKNDKYRNQKFERLFDDRVKKYELENLNYDNLWDFLKEFGCVASTGDEPRVKELWELVEGEKRQGITKANLCIVLKAIFKIPIKTVNSPNSTGVSFSSDNSIELTNKQCAHLSTTFANFYINKSLTEKNAKVPYEIYSFKPKINKNTEKLAAMARSRMPSKYITKIIDGKLETRLMDEYKRKKEWKVKQKELKEEEEIKKFCTFRPHISKLDSNNCYKSIIDSINPALTIARKGKSPGDLDKARSNSTMEGKNDFKNEESIPFKRKEEPTSKVSIMAEDKKEIVNLPQEKVKKELDGGMETIANMNNEITNDEAFSRDQEESHEERSENHNEDQEISREDISPEEKID